MGEQNSASALIGTAGRSFCGQQLPNYPGPSVLISAANSLTVNYHTAMTSLQRGKGFQATVSAVNPLCSPMSFQHKYGDCDCNNSCGDTIVEPATTTSTTTTSTTSTTTITTVTTTPSTTTTTTTTT